MTTFRTALQLTGKVSGIPVPEEVVLGLGAGKRVPVAVTLNGYTYRNTVGPYRGEYMIALSVENREAAGLVGDEEIDVTIEVDSAPREVEVPADFAAALATDAAAQAAFDKLSYSGKRQHTLSIEGAKTPETRQRRIAKSIATLGSA
ncbi:YdeI/OmpD-associated family protein [Glaciibacter superstes]|uniref:YdeI/OmpD-associated family protein n=1 Tax=Glaciibacter superstes TaxID=501023 RepID=UPI0003B5EE87|nr:YdeI/OmpD-associated family protein [Glaciibacter superstes]